MKNNKRIKIIGVGCGGVNIVKHLYVKYGERFSFAAIDMDSMVLKNIPDTMSVQLGKDGLGSGNRTEIALKAANEGSKKILGLFEDKLEIVVAVACLGGGTGSVVAPLIANIAKSLGHVAMAVVTTPFQMEGLNKYERAIDSIREIAKDVNILYVINNELSFQSLASFTMTEAFTKINIMAEDAILSMVDMYNKAISTEGVDNYNILRKIWRRFFRRVTN